MTPKTISNCAIIHIIFFRFIEIETQSSAHADNILLLLLLLPCHLARYRIMRDSSADNRSKYIAPNGCYHFFYDAKDVNLLLSISISIGMFQFISQISNQ